MQQILSDQYVQLYYYGMTQLQGIWIIDNKFWQGSNH